jgi:diguanylate cyclase (GGDEF)-like protein
MVIAPETDMQGAIVLGERIRTTVEASVFTYQGEVIPVRVSIGFAVVETDVATDYETLKHLAAAALSDAKNSGRNKCAYRLVPKHPVDQAG